MAQNLIVFFVGLELLSVPALRPLRLGAQAPDLARVGAQVPDRRKPRLGHAPLRPRLHLRRLGLDGLHGHPRGHRRRHGRRPADPDRHRAHGHGARLQALDRALPPVDSRRLPGRPDPGHRLHGGRDQGGGLRGLRALLRGRAWARRGRLAARACRPRRGLDHRRQRRRADPELAQAPPRLLGHRAGRLHARRHRRRQRGGDRSALLLPRRVRVHEPRGLRGDHDPRAADRLRRRHPLRAGAGARAAPCWHGRSRSRCSAWRACPARPASSASCT